MQLRPILVLGVARSVFGFAHVRMPMSSSAKITSLTSTVLSGSSSASSSGEPSTWTRESVPSSGGEPSSSSGDPSTWTRGSTPSRESSFGPSRLVTAVAIERTNKSSLVATPMLTSSSESTDVKKSLDVSNKNSPKQQQQHESMIHVGAAAAAAAEELTSLDVSGFGENLTDEAFLELVKGFKSELNSVNVSGCRNLTDEALKAIARRSLRSLDASRCGKLLTDEAIKAIASGCPSLESLNVADCKFLTDESITAIAAGCGDFLKTIDVSRCKQLTDGSIKALAAGCPKLTSLNVRNCEKLTDEAMRAVATLKELKELRIFGCRKLTEESIEHLVNGGPGTKQLTTLDTTNTLRQIFKKASRRDTGDDTAF